MYLFWHFITVGVVNAWNVYRKDHTLLHHSSDMLKRSRFQATVAASLIHVNASRKRGRPSESPRDSPVSIVRSRTAPCADIRHDGYHHMPQKDVKRGRCKLCSVNNTNTMCSKCQVRLCFTEDRNCFKDYHMK